MDGRTHWRAVIRRGVLRKKVVLVSWRDELSPGHHILLSRNLDLHTWHDLLAIAATLYLCIYRVKILRSHIQVAQGQHLVN